MKTQKVFTFLILLIVIQGLAAGYLFKDELHSYIDSYASLDEIKSFVQKFRASKRTSAVKLDESHKTPLREFKVSVPIGNWRWINENVATDKPRTKIPATLEVDGKSYECTIRISQGGPRHWMGERKSIRLRFPNDQLFNGIRELNLNIPETRMVIIEAVAWEFAKKLGLVTPEYDFVKLFVNGKYEGLRLLYEDVDGFFLRRNKLMGYIFTEDRFWFPFQYESANDADYRKVKVINKKEPTLTELRNLCKILSYPSFEQFAVQIKKIADLDEIATWSAHALLCGSGHQNIHNIKLFYNTALQKFQFIPCDIAGFGHWGAWPNRPQPSWAMDLDWASNNFVYRLNLLPEFVEKRNQILWKALNGDLSVEKQLAIVDQYYKKVRYHIYADEDRQASEEKFTYQEFEDAVEALKQWIKLRARFILTELQKADLRVSTTALSQSELLLQNNDTKFVDGILIKLGTGQQSGVILHRLSIGQLRSNIRPENIKLFLDANANGQLDFADREITVASKRIRRNSSGVEIDLEIEEKLLPARKQYWDRFFDNPDKGYVLQPRPFYQYYQFILAYKARPTDPLQKIFSENVKLWARNAITGDAVIPQYFQSDPEEPFALRYREKTTPLLAGNVSALAVLDEKRSAAKDLTETIQKLAGKNKIVLPAGEYTLKSILRVGYEDTLIFTPGTSVKIFPGASIYVRGVLNVEGTPQEPVIFENALPGQAWGCIAFHNTDKISTISNAVVRYAGMASINGTYFTGGVSAYDATIILKHTTFDRIQADDGLNVKNSATKTIACRFIESADDAIDYDFSEGEIRDSYFYKPGGDAIDCGTANPLVYGNVVEYATDKGVSVGEASSPKIINNIIYGSHYGIAVKDDSNPIIRNNTLVHNDIGISFYIKKPDEFGCPTATLSHNIIWFNKTQIENLCQAEFSITDSAVEGGFPGKNIYEVAPELLPNSRGLEYLLKPQSFYAKQNIGALRNHD